MDSLLTRCGLAPDWTRCGPDPDWDRLLDSLWNRLRLDLLSGLAVDSAPIGLALWTRCGRAAPDWSFALDPLWSRARLESPRTGLAVESPTGLTMDSLNGLDMDSPLTGLALEARCGLTPD